MPFDLWSETAIGIGAGSNGSGWWGGQSGLALKNGCPPQGGGTVVLHARAQALLRHRRSSRDRSAMNCRTRLVLGVAQAVRKASEVGFALLPDGQALSAL